MVPGKGKNKYIEENKPVEWPRYGRNKYVEENKPFQLSPHISSKQGEFHSLLCYDLKISKGLERDVHKGQRKQTQWLQCTSYGYLRKILLTNLKTNETISILILIFNLISILVLLMDY